jgi:hypothetical protein
LTEDVGEASRHILLEILGALVQNIRARSGTDSAKMENDPFDDLLELENEYYKEGYEAGVADSTYAGLIEGKVFGIEKGYEKALELGKLHGRALVWQSRFSSSKKTANSDDVQRPEGIDSPLTTPRSVEAQKLAENCRLLDRIPDNARLRKHVDALEAASDRTTVDKDNSDEAVSEFDDRIAKANAKAKVVANILGESLNPAATANSGIEDATGLQARH